MNELSNRVGYNIFNKDKNNITLKLTKTYT